MRLTRLIQNRAAILRAVAFVALSAPLATAHAVVLQLNSLAEFNSTATESNDFEATINTANITFDATSFRVSASTASDGVTTSGTQGLAELIQNEPLTAILGVDAFEVGLFFGNDETSIFDAILSVFDASNTLLGTVSVESNANDFVDQFIGLRSDTAIRRVDFAYQRPEAGNLAVYIDDFTIGLDRTVPAPAPAPIVLLAIGLAGLALRRRR